MDPSILNRPRINSVLISVPSRAVMLSVPLPPFAGSSVGTDAVSGRKPVRVSPSRGGEVEIVVASGVQRNRRPTVGVTAAGQNTGDFDWDDPLVVPTRFRASGAWNAPFGDWSTRIGETASMHRAVRGITGRAAHPRAADTRQRQQRSMAGARPSPTATTFEPTCSPVSASSAVVAGCVIRRPFRPAQSLFQTEQPRHDE